MQGGKHSHYCLQFFGDQEAQPEGPWFVIFYVHPQPLWVHQPRSMHSPPWSMLPPGMARCCWYENVHPRTHVYVLYKIKGNLHDDDKPSLDFRWDRYLEMRKMPTTDANAHRGFRTGLRKHFESCHKIFHMPLALMQTKKKNEHAHKLTKMRADELDIVEFAERYTEKGSTRLNVETFEDYVKHNIRREPGL